MTNPRAAIAPAVERTLGKGEVACLNHASSTIFFYHLIQSIELLYRMLLSMLNSAIIAFTLLKRVMISSSGLASLRIQALWPKG